MFITSQQKGKNIWTPEENAILKECKEQGLTAKEIMKRLPGRTTNQINNHWSKMNEKSAALKPMKSRSRSRDDDENDEDETTEEEEEEEEEEDTEEDGEEEKSSPAEDVE